MKKNKIIFICVFLLLFSFENCKKRNIEKNQYIENVVANIGTYNNLIVCINNRSNEIEGDFIFENKKVYFQNERINKTLLFDFDKKEKESYIFYLKIYYNKKDEFLKLNPPQVVYSDSFDILLDSIYVFNQKKYYKFVMLGGLCYFSSKLDINYFVQENRGIIGYYLSTKNEDEILIYQRFTGNCLQKYINYSIYKKFDFL